MATSTNFCSGRGRTNVSVFVLELKSLPRDRADDNAESIGTFLLLRKRSNSLKTRDLEKTMNGKCECKYFSAK